MKVFYCIFVTAFLCVVVHSERTSEESTYNKDVRMIAQLRQLSQEPDQLAKLKRAVLNVCPESGEKFEKAYMKMRECLSSTDLEEETMCSFVKNHVEKCSRPIISMLAQCLPDKSKDLPSFLMKSIVSSMNYICKIDGEHLFELQNPCLFNGLKRRCILKTQSKMQQYVSNTPSKEELCEFLKSMRFCLKSHVDSSCRHPITKEAFMNLFDTSFSLCETTDESFNEVETF